MYSIFTPVLGMGLCTIWLHATSYAIFMRVLNQSAACILAWMGVLVLSVIYMHNCGCMGGSRKSCKIFFAIFFKRNKSQCKHLQFRVPTSRY